MSVIVDGSLFQFCMVLGKNDILYSVVFVYGTKSVCDPRVLLSFDWTMDSDYWVLDQIVLNFVEHG